MKTEAGALLLMQGNLCYVQASGGFETDISETMDRKH